MILKNYGVTGDYSFHESSHRLLLLNWIHSCLGFYREVKVKPIVGTLDSFAGIV